MIKFNKIGKLVAGAVLAMSSSVALANHVPGFAFSEQSFTINPGAINEAGCGGGTCTATFRDFSYKAEVDQTQTGATSASFDETGGGYFELIKSADLAPTFSRVAQELRSQYLIAFAPEALDGKVHKLDVRVKRPGVTILRTSLATSRCPSGRTRPSPGQQDDRAAHRFARDLDTAVER